MDADLVLLLGLLVASVTRHATRRLLGRRDPEPSEADFSDSPASIPGSSTFEVRTPGDTGSGLTATPGSDPGYLHARQVPAAPSRSVCEQGDPLPAAGDLSGSRCAGRTKAGATCRRTARHGSRYCHLHDSAEVAKRRATQTSSTGTAAPPGQRCEARTQRETRCRRRPVRGFRYCHVHARQKVRSGGAEAERGRDRANGERAKREGHRKGTHLGSTSWCGVRSRRRSIRPYILVALEQRSDEWHRWRRNGIGASDAPAIMGENPWRGPEEVLAEKLGVARVWMNDRMARGIKLEPEARARYRDTVGRPVEPVCVQSRQYGWMRASLDGLSPDGNHVVEIKCGESVHDYCSRRRKPPPYYDGQLQHILAITGLPRIDLWCYLPGRDPVLLSISRDGEYIERLVAREAAFWKEVLRRRSG